MEHIACYVLKDTTNLAKSVQDTSQHKKDTEARHFETSDSGHRWQMQWALDTHSNT
jgi:hypothetical protein